MRRELHIESEHFYKDKGKGTAYLLITTALYRRRTFAFH